MTRRVEHNGQGEQNGQGTHGGQQGRHWQPALGRRGGSNQTQVGIYNERLLLDWVRRHPGSAAVDISRNTGLSAQTVTGIINRLLAEGLLVKLGRRNGGGIGQPAVPLGLCAEGAYSIGVKIGRAMSESMLVDFNGAVLRHHCQRHDYPDAGVLLPWMKRRISAYCAALGDKVERVAGVGVATFFGYGGWRDIYEVPAQTVRQWEQVDFAQALATRRGLRVLLVNDATAACMAESELGGTVSGENFLYFYIGAFVGGGVVLNRQVFFGDNGNAGALASLPFGRHQLMHHASLYLLNNALAEIGCSLSSDSPQARRVIATWCRDAARALAQAIVSAVAVLDMNEVVIDGELPPLLLQELVGAVNKALTPVLLRGLLRPRVLVGRQGDGASCRGAAWMPLYVQYSPAQALLLKRLPVVAV